jgi:hypothetical protein
MVTLNNEKSSGGDPLSGCILGVRDSILTGYLYRAILVRRGEKRRKARVQMANKWRINRYSNI